MKRRLHLNLFIYGRGHHEAAWRHPRSSSRSLTDIEHWIDCARTAEAAHFDSIFLADVLNLPPDVDSSARLWLEPLTALGAIAHATSRIGLIGTASTSHTEPFNLARQFCSLDHISRGRAGWNIVTSFSIAGSRNFGGAGRLSHSERYDKGEEFVQVVKALWNSWRDDAVVDDRQHGVYIRKDRIREIAHKGANFEVAGPLNLPRSPQGWPVLVQAGGSPSGLEFAAMVGETIFAAQGKRDEAIKFRNAVRARMPVHGRDPELLRILPGLVPIMGATEKEALEKEKMLNELLHPAVGIWMLSEQMDFRLYDYPQDGPLPTAEIRATGKAFTPRVVSLLERADREGLSVHQCGVLVAASRSHGSVVGTPEQIADHMQLWLDEGACDGFNIMPAFFHDEFDLFVDQVVPILQRRGIYRTDYEGTTLRDHLGLPKPRRGAGP